MTVTTAFEDRDSLEPWTTLDEEATFLDALVAAADGRVRVEETARTFRDRPQRVILIGHPAPPALDEWPARASLFVEGGLHGNEPAGREPALQLARDIALDDSPAMLDYLAEHPVVIMATVNPDGIDRDRRETDRLVDMNRDGIDLTQSESVGLARVYGAVRPAVYFSTHEMYMNPETRPNMETRAALNPNIDAAVLAESKRLVTDVVYPAIQSVGGTAGPYTNVLQEGLPLEISSVLGAVSLITESMRTGESAADRTRWHLAAHHAVRDYHAANGTRLRNLTRGADQQNTTGGASGEIPVMLWSGTLYPAPGGYRITAADAEATAVQREAFGITTEPIDGSTDLIVPMGQPARGVIPYLYDPAHERVIAPATRVPRPTPDGPGGGHHGAVRSRGGGTVYQLRAGRVRPALIVSR